MKTINATLMLLLCSFLAMAQSSNAVLDAYLKVKNDLVRSESKKTITDINTLKKAVAESDISNKNALSKAVDKMSKSTDIEKQRNGFAEVSTLLWAVVKDDTTINHPVYYQYCPMKKSYWISNEADIKNPYYGNKMLTCGNVAEQTK